jgi:hypothetical protein
VDVFKVTFLDYEKYLPFIYASKKAELDEDDNLDDEDDDEDENVDYKK